MHKRLETGGTLHKLANTNSTFYRPFKGRQVKRRKRKTQRYLQKNGRAFLGEEQAQRSEIWTLLGGPKDTKARKSWQKAMMAFRRVGFRPYQHHKKGGKTRIIPRTKAKERIIKEKARKKLILNPDFQPLKHLEEEGKSHALECEWHNDSWTSDTW